MIKNNFTTFHVLLLKIIISLAKCVIMSILLFFPLFEKFGWLFVVIGIVKCFHRITCFFGEIPKYDY